ARMGRSLHRRLLCILMVMIAAPVLGQTVDEYEIKAAFLFNFTKFVEWPPKAQATAFVICILGDDPFGSTIDRVVNGKNVFGLPLQVRRLKDAAEAKHCQIVFAGLTETAKAARLIEALRGMPVLTVGENRDFLRQGGMISLDADDGRVNIAINAGAAENAGLKISAKLMTLAKLYKTDQRGGSK